MRVVCLRWVNIRISLSKSLNSVSSGRKGGRAGNDGVCQAVGYRRVWVNSKSAGINRTGWTEMVSQREIAAVGREAIMRTRTLNVQQAQHDTALIPISQMSTLRLRLQSWQTAQHRCESYGPLWNKVSQPPCEAISPDRRPQGHTEPKRVMTEREVRRERAPSETPVMGWLRRIHGEEQVKVKWGSLTVLTHASQLWHKGHLLSSQLASCNWLSCD